MLPEAATIRSIDEKSCHILTLQHTSTYFNSWIASLGQKHQKQIHSNQKHIHSNQMAHTTVWWEHVLEKNDEATEPLVEIALPIHSLLPTARHGIATGHALFGKPLPDIQCTHASEQLAIQHSAIVPALLLPFLPSPPETA